MLGRVKTIAASVGGRIGLGMAALGALFWLQFDPKDLPDDWEKIVGALAATGAWLWAEIASHKTGPHPDDVALMNKLRARFSDASRAFVRTHNFGDSFRPAQLDGFSDFGREWTGAAYEFHDKRMQGALEALRIAVDTFGDDLALSAGPVTGNPALMTTMTIQDMNVGQRSPQTLATIDRLNQEAVAAIGALDDIERLAKKRLRAS